MSQENVENAKRGVAALNKREAPDELAEELRAWCKQRMRRYEYPHIVEFVDDLPRTLTGKVQRFRLREWAAQVSERKPEAMVDIATATTRRVRPR